MRPDQQTVRGKFWWTSQLQRNVNKVWKLRLLIWFVVSLNGWSRAIYNDLQISSKEVMKNIERLLIVLN